MSNPKTCWNALGCPFCGRRPTIEPWHGGRKTKRMITCSAEYADECPVAPSVTGETRKLALAAWNTRAPFALVVSPKIARPARRA